MTTVPRDVFRRRDRLRVVLFSGGRGSGALGRLLIRDPRIDLTIAINGYDDGASTGEVRRFLGACLGPSDFRKNASRLAAELKTAPDDLIALLDNRLPVPCDATMARRTLHALPETRQPWRADVARRLDAFFAELDRTGRPFVFADCSVGNLVFAGGFLLAGRDFNAAVEDYCGLLGLPSGLIVNVTDGTDAYLVALDTSGEVLASEEAVVDAKRQNRIDDIFLIDRPLDVAEQSRVSALSLAERRAFLTERTTAVRVNPAIVTALGNADLIIYAPGTQHSSLFPSYLTPGLSGAIASNLSAIKLLVTNLQRDAEITGASAVDIIDRALFYLREKGRRTEPTPCLITHYLLNDPGQESAPAYVPLGAVETLEDPRLVRIGHYEDGVTGHHDAEKILAPFVASLLATEREPSVVVYLHDADSPNKLTQTLLEMVRAGVADLPLSITVMHTLAPIEASLSAALPFRVMSVPSATALEALKNSGCEYTILFESSGMYRGDDLVALASQLAFVKLDAVWGSRRLSVKDVEEALVLRYQNNWLQKTASRFGSHVLSLMYLALFGRYMSDTLSGARAVRTRYLAALTVDPAHKLANHQLLAAILRDRGEVLEVPVRFFPISPKRVKRTSILDGGRAMLEIVTRRFA